MLYVEDMRAVEAARWDCLLLHSPGGGHALQTYAWGEFKKTQGWTPLRLALKDGAHVVGVGQVLLRRPPGVPGVVAYCPKGPWIDWTNGAHVRAMLQGMERIVRGRGAFILKVESELPSGPGQPTRIPPSIEEPLHRFVTGARRLRGLARGDGRTGPAEEADDARVAEARASILEARAAQACDGRTPGRAAFMERGYVKSRWDMQFRTTMVIDLDCPPEALLARMKSKWRYNVNLARRKGVTVVQDDSRRARRCLYDMYERTARRQGFFLRQRAYSLGAWEAMIEAGHAHIFFACHEGRPLAALLALTFAHKAWYLVGASESEGRNVMPAHALQFHVMQWAQQRGLTYYDLVAIPNVETISAHDSMWNLYVFKAGFGGRPVEWVGCLDKVLDPRGQLWEAFEPAYYRLYRWRAGDVMY
jgi:peptidoglycan pentaglycine glycine transferase (the first glycine)